MEVLDSTCALLTNAEALVILQENVARRGNKRVPVFVSGVEAAVTEHLNQPGVEPLQVPVCTAMFKDLEEFELTKPELLQIANHLPRSVVELYCIVECLEQRFSKEQIEDILNRLSKHAPPQPEA